MSGPVFFTIAIFDIAMPVFVPVAHAPMENALIAKSLRVPKSSVMYPATFLCTVLSSRFERIQLYGVPDDPLDSSTTVPTVSMTPCQHLSGSG